MSNYVVREISKSAPAYKQIILGQKVIYLIKDELLSLSKYNNDYFVSFQANGLFGYIKLFQVTEEFASLVIERSMSRSDIVDAMWVSDY